MECGNNLFNCGTSEGNGGGVLSCGPQSGCICSDNTFIGWDNEVNSSTGQDFWIWGNRWRLINCIGSATNSIAGGWQHSINGGTYGFVTIGASATKTFLEGCEVSQSSRLIDGGNYTDMIGILYSAGSDAHQSQLNAFRINPYIANNVAAGATFTVDAALSSSFQATYSGDFTLANPLNPINGQRLIIRLTHSNDANTYAITNFASAWNVPASLTRPTLNVANGSSYLEAQYNSTSAKWDVFAWKDTSQ